MTLQYEWMPIHTAPQDEAAVLLFDPAWDIFHVGIRYAGIAAWQQPSGDLLRTPTHWMPLPPPPPGEKLQPTE